ncbi:hypothetical protein Tco_1557963, partial [Tanacetum coccineum]
LNTNVFLDLRMRPLPRNPRGILLDRSRLILKHVKEMLIAKYVFASMSVLHYFMDLNWMRLNKGLYMDYGALLEIPGMRTISEFDDYLARMSRDKTWGDIITLYAATNVVRLPLVSCFQHEET